MNNANLHYADTLLAWKQRVGKEMRSKSNYVNRAYKIHDKIYDVQDPAYNRTRKDTGTFKPDKSWHKGLNK